jgi:hypothetical protein
MSVLPTKKELPSVNIHDYFWMLYGPPGVGKTTLAMNFDSPLLLLFGDKSSHIEGYRKEVSTWKEFEKIITALTKEKHEFKTIIIDTVDMLYKIGCEEVITKVSTSTGKALQHINDVGYGKGQDMVAASIIKSIMQLREAGFCVVIISHSVFTEIVTFGETYNKIMPSVQKQLRTVIIGMLDFIGYIDYDDSKEKKRLITFGGSKYIEAKRRNRENIIEVPEDFYLTDDKGADIGFKELRSYFKSNKKGQ